MSSGPFLDTAARRRRRDALERRRRARRRFALALLALVAAVGVGAFVVVSGDDGGGDAEPRASVERRDVTPPPEELEALAPTPGQTALGPLPLQVDLADVDDPVRVRFKRPPRAGLLVNLDTGEVLWRRNPE